MVQSYFALTLVAGSMLACSALAQGTKVSKPMGFFITSTGLFDGGNLGGLDGADAHRQSLAEQAGAGDRE